MKKAVAWPGTHSEHPNSARTTGTRCKKCCLYGPIRIAARCIKYVLVRRHTKRAEASQTTRLATLTRLPCPWQGVACSMHGHRRLCHSRDTRHICQRLLAHAAARAAHHHVPRRRCCSFKQRCSVTAVNARIDAARVFCCSERGGWSSLDHPSSAERVRTF